MKKIVIIGAVLIAFVAAVAFSEWPNSHITPNPYESRAWEQVNDQYSRTFSWNTFNNYWSPVGFDYTNYAKQTIGLFAHAAEYQEYAILYAYYFTFSDSRDRWMLHQREPVEAHRLLWTKSDNYGVVMEDHKRYGSPFASRANENNGSYTVVSNYRRSDGSTFTVVYQSVFEVNGAHFVRRMPQ